MDEARWEGSGPAVDSRPGFLTSARCASNVRVTRVIVTIARPGWHLPGGAPCTRWAAPERRRLGCVALTGIFLLWPERAPPDDACYQQKPANPTHLSRTCRAGPISGRMSDPHALLTAGEMPDEERRYEH